VHTGGILDIPFPRSIHDALLSEGLAQEHRWVPNSGWVTLRIHNDHDFHLGIWVLRISYLRHALKTVPNPRKMFERETQELHLSPRFKSLLEPFISRSGKEILHQPVPA
jgi:hypothetical protein